MTSAHTPRRAAPPVPSTFAALAEPNRYRIVELLHHDTLRPESMHDLRTWIDRHRGLWEHRFRAMDELLDDLVRAREADDDHRE